MNTIAYGTDLYADRFICCTTINPSKVFVCYTKNEKIGNRTTAVLHSQILDIDNNTITIGPDARIGGGPRFFNMSTLTENKVLLAYRAISVDHAGAFLIGG